MRHGNRIQHDFLVHHDGAGTRIENHAGNILARRYRKVFQPRDECHALRWIHRRRHANLARIDRYGNPLPEITVDRFDHARCRGEIAGIQFEIDKFTLTHAGRHHALDCRARRHATHAQLIDLHAGTAGRCTRTGHQQIALRHRVYLAIRPLERRHQQGAAAQTFGITDGRHRDIDCLAGLGKRRQRRRDHHGGDILQLQAGSGRNIDAHLAQHADDAAYGKRRLRCLVACSIQPHHNAVTGQLVVAHALYRCNILDTLGMRLTGQHQQAHQDFCDGVFHIDPLERQQGHEEAGKHADHLRGIQAFLLLGLDTRIGHQRRTHNIG